MRENRPTKAYQRWIDRFPAAYRGSLLDEQVSLPEIAEPDPYCLAMLKHYRSLMPMAMEARKRACRGTWGEHERNAFPYPSRRATLPDAARGKPFRILPADDYND